MRVLNIVPDNITLSTMISAAPTAEAAVSVTSSRGQASGTTTAEAAVCLKESLLWDDPEKFKSNLRQASDTTTSGGGI